MNKMLLYLLTEKQIKICFFKIPESVLIGRKTKCFLDISVHFYFVRLKIEEYNIFAHFEERKEI